MFASAKLPLRCYLAAIAIFCNEVKGKSALALSRDLNVSYKCAFVLLHKLREAMAEESRRKQCPVQFAGVVCAWCGEDSIGAGGGNRTHGLGIMRPSLYH